MIIWFLNYRIFFQLGWFLHLKSWRFTWVGKLDLDHAQLICTRLFVRVLWELVKRSPAENDYFLQRYRPIWLQLLLRHDLICFFISNVLVINGKHTCSEHKRQLVWWICHTPWIICHNNCAPAHQNNIQHTTTKYPLRWSLFLCFIFTFRIVKNVIIPQNADILGVNLEKTWIEKIPRHRFTGLIVFVSSVEHPLLPCSCLQIKQKERIFGREGFWINHICLGCAAQNNHVEFVKTESPMTLSRRTFRVKTILHLTHFVCHRIKHVHTVYHLVFVI